MTINFFSTTKRVFIAAIFSSLLIGSFCLAYVFTKNIGFIMAAFGSLIIALYSLFLFDEKRFEKFALLMPFAFFSSLSLFLGSLLARNSIAIILLILIYVCIMTWGIRYGHRIYSFFSLSLVLMMISLDLPSTHVFQAVYFSGTYFLGALVYVLCTTLIHVPSQQFKHHREETRPFTAHRIQIIFGLCMSVMLMVAYALQSVLPVQEGHWIPMTALIVFHYNYDNIIQKIQHRLWGTLLGSIFAFLLAFLTHNPLFLVLTLYILIFLMVNFATAHYGMYTFFLTIMIASLFGLTRENIFALAEFRILNTLIGLLCAFFAMHAYRLFLGPHASLGKEA